MEDILNLAGEVMTIMQKREEILRDIDFEGEKRMTNYAQQMERIDSTAVFKHVITT